MILPIVNFYLNLHTSNNEEKKMRLNSGSILLGLACFLTSPIFHNITGNVHIEHRRSHSTCGAAPAMPHCASSVLPVVHSPQRMLSIWQVLAVQVLISMGQMQSAVAV